ncbi:serine hydrolase domain-containing protein [Jiulongibacter sediminis]|uniref:Beta-lactamase n=1 Tax=Jiulongibacter sediminis TaxID=1605367 RepID=A0A0P7BY75_9BACT|nr:serine hydrolase [Jiulongibacter sediminis]KPM47053.1 beta-lactamase [Jiulongibacter sediminis]TBX22396.1 beta-lactamase [Jiulongibacter sediminis]
MNSTRRIFLKQAGLGSLGLAALPFLTQCQSGESAANGPFVFDPVSPESQGVDSQAILDFVKAADTSGLEWHSFMILRNGKVLSEGYWKPFKEGLKHTLYSLSKSFTSSAIGFAVAEGLITVEDQVISFFPDDLPEEISENLNTMKIKHLLTMNTGHETDTMGPIRENPDQPWVQSFLAHPVLHEPGSHFLYNTGGTYILGAILHKKTGQTLEEYLKPRLFDKLEITNYDWEKSPQGLNTAGYGLRVTTNDIAKFGQLYVQKGNWKGEQLLSEEWVEEATRKHTDSQDNDSDWGQGYGYQFWRCKPEPGFFRGDGAFGQYCIMIPQYDMVLAVNSETFDMGKSMQIMWDHILPGVHQDPLPENEAATNNLKEACEKLSLPVPAVRKTSELAAEINQKRFGLTENDFGVKALTFDIAADQGELKIETEDGENTLRFGVENWLVNDEFTENNFPLQGRIHVPSLIASTATWIDDKTLQINRKFIEAIHGDTLTCTFEGDQVTVSFNNSVSANNGETEDSRGSISGKA